MHEFKDVLGQEWELEFDAFSLDQIEKETKIDLADLTGKGLLTVERDVKALVAVLCVACKEQLRSQRKPEQEFQKQIRKDAITRAREAVMGALADFFPESEWSAMRSNLKTLKDQPDMTPEQLQLAAGFLKMDPEVQRDVMSLIRQETDGSLPSSLDKGFVLAPDAIPFTPVSGSPESAESAPEG